MHGEETRLETANLCVVNVLESYVYCTTAMGADGKILVQQESSFLFFCLVPPSKLHNQQGKVGKKPAASERPVLTILTLA